MKFETWLAQEMPRVKAIVRFVSTQTTTYKNSYKFAILKSLLMNHGKYPTVVGNFLFLQTGIRFKFVENNEKEQFLKGHIHLCKELTARNIVCCNRPLDRRHNYYDFELVLSAALTSINLKQIPFENEVLAEIYFSSPVEIRDYIDLRADEAVHHVTVTMVADYW